MDLTALQMDRFLTEGHLVINNFFTPSVCKKLLLRMTHLIEQQQDQIPYTIFSTETNEHALTDYFINSSEAIHFFFEPQAFDSQGKLRQPLAQSLNKVGHALHEKDEVFHQYSYDPRIKIICEQLGFKQPSLLQSMYIFKQANIGAEVNCHQDGTYLHTQDSDVLGFWIALQDATIDNGCLQVLPCPHTTKLKQRMMRREDNSIYFNHFDKTPWPEQRCIPLEVKQGSLILLHGTVPHKSNANTSQQSRHAYTLHVVDASCPYPSSNWLQRRHGLMPWPQRS